MATSYTALFVILSLQQVLCAQNFIALEWSTQTSFPSSQCGTASSSSDLSSAISTVAQMIANSIDYIPRSCLEVKNGSPESPSGYYAIMNDNSGVTSIVYCDMDDLNTCPDLEQSLTGIMSTFGTLTTTVSGLQSNYEALTASVSGVQGSVENLQTGSQNNYEALSASLDNLQSGLQNEYEALIALVDNLQTDFDMLQDSDNVTSCEDIKSKWPWATSGWYKISSEDVYCYMGDRCGMTGPWRRVLYLDMTDPSQTCPDVFQLHSSSGVRVCGRPGSVASCEDIMSSTSSLSYSKICGRVIGYQLGSPNGFVGGTIDDIYVDGVSITRGSPRQHVWTLSNPFTESSTTCPCSGGSVLSSFVGDDYYCESALSSTVGWTPIVYTSDPLWDGQECNAAESSCCEDSDLPWFYKDLGSSTTDYIELRICGDQEPTNEDSTVSLYEIYVQ